MTWSWARPSHSQIAQTTGSWLSTMQAAMHCSKKHGLVCLYCRETIASYSSSASFGKKRCSGPRKAHDLSNTSFRMPRPANHFNFPNFVPIKHTEDRRETPRNAEMRRGQTPRNAEKLPGHALVALICLRLTNSEERCVEWWFAVNLM